ncbi:hypothetical protein LCGC14_2383830, partial [marine sediment metagenome]
MERRGKCSNAGTEIVSTLETTIGIRTKPNNICLMRIQKLAAILSVMI